MTTRIRQLSAAVANQIAAGEVIERPASVVKELLENAQDAKATAITIDIGHGGLNQVKISDNGAGILAEDLPLAIAAHATSKLASLTDLYAITSMGFRGEALASIASIARVSISSRPLEQESGMLLNACSGHIDLLPCARTQGTSVDVRDIFYNAPVRKKFLKSERSEFQAIDWVVRRFALGQPSIAITLNHNGKLHLHLPAASDEHSKKIRMIKLLGKAFVEQSHVVDAVHAGMSLQGRISALTLQRSQHDRLWVYLNGRMVQDKLIQHAIKQAYEGLLHPGRFPSCLLYFEIDPAEVDVNVHPTKHEVRFQQPRYIHDFIRSQLQNSLSLHDTVCDYQFVPAVPVQESLQVREARPTPDYQIHVPMNDSGQHLSLNDHFSIVIADESPYLVNRQALIRHNLMHRLQEAELPLSSRPLLVPVYLEGEFSATAKEIMQQVGITVTEVKPGKLMVKTLPLPCPDLDIKSFVKALGSLSEEQPVSAEAVLNLLVAHQSTSVWSLSDEQAYVRQTLSDKDAHTFVRPLTLTVCKDLFDA